MSHKTSHKTQLGMIAVLVGMMGTGALAEQAPAAQAPRTQEAAPVATVTLQLKRGESKQLDVPGVTRVAVGDPAIADIAVVSGSAIQVKAVARGKTTVRVWTKDGTQTEYAIHVGK